MTEPAQSSNEKKSRSRLYFRIATGLLFVMALVWSIDPSFVYMLTGAILVFATLGFQNSAGITNIATQTYRFREQENVTFQQPAKRAVENGFKQTHGPRTVKLLIITIIVAFFVFIAIFMIMIMSDDSTDYDSGFQNEQAEIFYDRGEYDSAAIYYRRALAFDTENKEALTGYGNVLMMREHYDSAIIYYNSVLAIDPAYDKAAYQKGAVLSYQKKYQQSIGLLKELLDNNPSYADALQLIGDDYYNQQRYDSALAWYEKAYNGGVRNRYLFHLMGYIHETTGDNTNAIKLYQEALQYDSTVVDIYQRLSTLLPGQAGDFYRRKAAALEKESN